MISTRLPRIWFGGDYCPDQWPEEVWREDMRMLTLAGVSVATLPVFRMGAAPARRNALRLLLAGQGRGPARGERHLRVHGDLHGSGARLDGHPVP